MPNIKEANIRYLGALNRSHLIAARKKAERKKQFTVYTSAIVAIHQNDVAPPKIRTLSIAANGALSFGKGGKQILISSIII